VGLADVKNIFISAMIFMASIYTQADSNVRKTWFLMTGFFVFLILIGWLFSYLMDDQSILFVAVIFSILSSFGSYWYSDKIVLAMTRAVPLEHNQNPELYHIVENLCITAGLPLPKIYIIPETQPNAFATGRNAKHAVVAVTQGLLNKLEKKELEGVIAHELSHIGNKDMLLATVVAILAGILAMVSNMFLRVSFFGGRKNSDDNRGNAGALLMVLGLVSAILAPISATLIQLAISRKREFLADASGSLLTRYPEGLARALEKISADSTPMRITNNATSSLYFSNPFKGKQTTSWFTKLFMTHPPVEERIRSLRGMDIK
jgi:heat shock protein HtpX